MHTMNLSCAVQEGTTRSSFFSGGTRSQISIVKTRNCVAFGQNMHVGKSRRDFSSITYKLLLIMLSI